MINFQNSSCVNKFVLNQHSSSNIANSYHLQYLITLHKFNSNKFFTYVSLVITIDIQAFDKDVNNFGERITIFWHVSFLAKNFALNSPRTFYKWLI